MAITTAILINDLTQYCVATDSLLLADILIWSTKLHKWIFFPLLFVYIAVLSCTHSVISISYLFSGIYHFSLVWFCTSLAVFNLDIRVRLQRRGYHGGFLWCLVQCTTGKADVIFLAKVRQSMYGSSVTT